MSAADVLRAARERGIELIPDGEQLRYSGPRQVLTPDLLSELKRYKPDILAILSASHETHPCSRCHRFAFHEPRTCYWCEQAEAMGAGTVTIPGA